MRHFHRGLLVTITVTKEIRIQKEQQKVEILTSNFDPIDDDLPGVIPRKFRWF